MNIGVGTLQIALIVLGAFGISLLTAVRISYRVARRSSDELSIVLNVVGWGCILAAFGVPLLLAIAPLMGNGELWFVWIIILFALLFPFPMYAAIVRNEIRKARLRNMMLCIAAATERQIPLAQAIEAMAWERSDRFGRFCQALAGRLAQGSNIADAYPARDAESFVAIRMGVFHSRLADSIRESLKLPNRGRAVLRYCYGAMILSFAILVMFYIRVRTAPSFQMLALEFNGQLSQLQQIADWTRVPLGVAYFVTLAFVIIVMMSQLGRNLPIINRLSLPMDHVRIVRAVASAVKADRPIEETLSFLATQYPKAHVRTRLAILAASQAAGQDWIDAFANGNILSPAEASVLRASRRSGNLAWGLEEMVQHKLRRIDMTWKRADVWLIPAFTLMLGLLVGVVGYAIFQDLGALVHPLSQPFF